MADDLADSRIVGEAGQNLILTIAVKRYLGKSIEFQYFKNAFPDKMWFAIPQVYILPLSPSPSPTPFLFSSSPFHFSLPRPSPFPTPPLSLFLSLPFLFPSSPSATPFLFSLSPFAILRRSRFSSFPLLLPVISLLPPSFRV